MGRVRTRKICRLDDEVVPQEEIAKGYEISKDKTVPVTDDELDQMPLPTAKAIEIVAFVDSSAGSLHERSHGRSRHLLPAAAESPHPRPANRTPPSTGIAMTVRSIDRHTGGQQGFNNQGSLGLRRKMQRSPAIGISSPRVGTLSQQHPQHIHAPIGSGIVHRRPPQPIPIRHADHPHPA